ncbi:unannotated protein [freshwater metagenome]|uniref:Unannotated protein n=1 Tax=freshwater metagenome TaxID=449393 RepID=A0A6J7H240_9ZZZZ|nr:hypothetical protein [Actinomycetota bacterium]
MQGPQDDAQGGRPTDDDGPYTVYGGRGGRTPRTPRPGGGRPAGDRGASAASRGDDGGARASAAGPDGEGPGYTVYEARRRGRGGDEDGGGPPPGPRRRRFGRGRRGVGRSAPRRILRWVATAAVAWVALSVVLFVVSATVHQQGGNVGALLGGGAPPFTPTNVLILGTDDRPPGSKEPGSEGGSARTDTMLLMRTGGLANAKLSIPRDTAVDVPNHGRQKINAAYAFDGIRGSVGSVENLTGIDVNHVATVDFENFPGLIDAMGGVNYTPKTCLTADVSGGANRPRAGVTIGYDKKLGGTSFRLKKGRSYRLEGSAALALARVRKNRCDPGQDDVDRAGRQQEVVGAMKRRILSPAGFVRMPLIAWKAPQAVKTDMSGFTLLGVAIGQFLPGSGGSHVLKPTGVESIPGGGQALSVSPEAVERARRRYEK